MLCSLPIGIHCYYRVYSPINFFPPVHKEKCNLVGCYSRYIADFYFEDPLNSIVAVYDFFGHSVCQSLYKMKILMTLY